MPTPKQVRYAMWWISSVPVVIVWLTFVVLFKLMCHFGAWLGFPMGSGVYLMVWRCLGVEASYLTLYPRNKKYLYQYEHKTFKC